MDRSLTVRSTEPSSVNQTLKIYDQSRFHSNRMQYSTSRSDKIPGYSVVSERLDQRPKLTSSGIKVPVLSPPKDVGSSPTQNDYSLSSHTMFQPHSSRSSQSPGYGGIPNNSFLSPDQIFSPPSAKSTPKYLSVLRPVNVTQASIAATNHLHSCQTGFTYPMNSSLRLKTDEYQQLFDEKLCIEGLQALASQNPPDENNNNKLFRNNMIQQFQHELSPHQSVKNHVIVNNIVDQPNPTQCHQHQNMPRHERISNQSSVYISKSSPVSMTSFTPLSLMHPVTLNQERSALPTTILKQPFAQWQLGHQSLLPFVSSGIQKSCFDPNAHHKPNSVSLIEPSNGSPPPIQSDQWKSSTSSMVLNSNSLSPECLTSCKRSEALVFDDTNLLKGQQNGDVLSSVSHEARRSSTLGSPEWNESWSSKPSPSTTETSMTCSDPLDESSDDHPQGTKSHIPVNEIEIKIEPSGNVSHVATYSSHLPFIKNSGSYDSINLESKPAMTRSSCSKPMSRCSKIKPNPGFQSFYFPPSYFYGHHPERRGRTLSCASSSTLPLSENSFEDSSFDSSGIRKRKPNHPRRSPQSWDPDFHGVTVRMQTKVDEGASQLAIKAYFSCNKGCHQVMTSNATCKHIKDSSTLSRNDSSTSDEENPIFRPPVKKRRYKHPYWGKKCASCGTKKTPLWRDAEDGTSLCNACGIRYKKYRVRCNQCWHIPHKESKSIHKCTKCGQSLGVIVGMKRN